MDSSPHSEASKLLEAALEQMDGIIQGAKFDTPVLNGGGSGVSALNAALNNLKLAICGSSASASSTTTALDHSALGFVWNWMRNFDLEADLDDDDDEEDYDPVHLSKMEERLQNNEKEKDSLQLQVAILTEQIERQADRISELERHLKRKHDLLVQADMNLDKEKGLRAELSAKSHLLSMRILALERANEDLKSSFSESSFNHNPMVISTPESPINDGSTPKKGTLKKMLFGKMKRSNSGTQLRDDDEDRRHHRGSASPSPFRRGGSRATIGGRVEHFVLEKKPFDEWNVDNLVAWLESLGLGAYGNEIRRNITDGKHFASLNLTAYESKLGIKHPLHRKKIYLAMLAKSKGDSPAEGKLDHHWVLRWLDDLGLPQYKEQFLEAKIDGRVLNMLTPDDLSHLKINNLLHHLSIKRGIQVLRLVNFDPTCIKRRCIVNNDNDEEEGEDEGNPDEIMVWSNHRVMEWLKQVDLSEYAPNLRGSGVHGGVLIHESRFNDDLLAALLSIPSNKTLLRRHLSIRFKELVGRDVMMEKRFAQNDPNLTPLTPTAKAKTSSRITQGQFSLKRKKSKSLLDYDDLLCPFSKN